MIGNHGYLVILDTYVKRVSGFNITAAYQAMKEGVSAHHTATSHPEYLQLYQYCYVSPQIPPVVTITLSRMISTYTQPILFRFPGFRHLSFMMLTLHSH